MTQDKAVLSLLCLTETLLASDEFRLMSLPRPHDFRYISLRSRTCPVGCEYAVSTIGVPEVISRFMMSLGVQFAASYRLCVPEYFSLLPTIAFYSRIIEILKARYGFKDYRHLHEILKADVGQVVVAVI